MSNKITHQRSPAAASAHEMAPAIEMIDLCKKFGALRAVDHLSLSVKPGEIFGLLGPNGSGKTTTIDMLSGLSIPTSGEVRVMGYDVRRQARAVRQILGAVPQMINLVSQESELRDIAVREPTLDEIFLRLTGTALRD